MRRTRRPQLQAVLVLALLNAFVPAAGAGLIWKVEARLAAVPHPVEREPVSAPSVLDASGQRLVGSAPFRDGLLDTAGSPALGSSVAAMVLDPATGRVLARSQARQPATPASALKLATGAAALRAVGPSTRLTTRTVRGQQPDTVILVGGGDPTLAGPQVKKAGRGYPPEARIAELAERTAASLRRSGTDAVRLRYDASLFTGPAESKGWKDSYVPNGYVGPVTALSVDAGRARPGSDTRVADPPEDAATAFAQVLRKRGITVRGDVREQAAAPDAPELAAVRSPPVALLVERMLRTSDNDLAEALGRHVALAVDKPASFAGATAAVRQVLGQLDVPTAGLKLLDCSGLAHGNTVTARALARVLALAASPEHPRLRTLLTGLPVAGYSGTLADRYGEKGESGNDGGGGDAAAGLGLVRAKTGTLNGVSALAGIAHRGDGSAVVFAFLADQVPPGGVLAARDGLDEMAATLVAPGRGEVS